MMTRQVLQSALPLPEALRIYDRCMALQDGTVKGAVAAREALAAEHRRLHA